MKKILSLIIILFTISNYAQVATVKLGSVVNEDTYNVTNIPIDNDEFVKVAFVDNKTQNGLVILTKYDSNLKELATKSITGREKIIFNKIVNLQGASYLLGINNGVTTSKLQTARCAQKINLKTLELEGSLIEFKTLESLPNPKSICEAEIFPTYLFEYDPWIFKNSADKSKLLVFGLMPTKESEIEQYYISVYDASMNKLIEKVIKLPYETKNIAMMYPFITNLGEVGIVARYFEKGDIYQDKIKKDGIKIPGYVGKIFMYDKDLLAMKEYTLNIQNKFLRDIKILDEGNNKLTIGGLFHNNLNGYTRGYFLGEVNRTNTTINITKMEDFDNEIIASAKIENQANDDEKNWGLDYHYKIGNLIRAENGSLFCVLEYTGPLNTSSSVRLLRSIIVANFKTDSKPVYTRIPRQQYAAPTGAYGANSYFTTIVKNKINIFYNCHKKDLQQDVIKKANVYSNPYNSLLVMATINEDGTIGRQLIYDNIKSEIGFFSNSCEMLSSQKIILTGQLYRIFGNKLITCSSKNMLGIVELK